MRILLFLFLTAYAHVASSQESPYIGKWNLTIDKDGNSLVSWLEVTKSGRNTLVGRFVYAFGSARPISEVKISKDGGFSFTIPKQWEPGAGDLSFNGNMDADNLKGEMTFTDGKKHSFTGTRAPKLASQGHTRQLFEKKLFNGTDLTGWKTGENSKWSVVGGVLTNPSAGANLVSEETFQDFHLEISFRYNTGANSGIYLRGRYEVQVEDSYGKEPTDILFGGIYGFLTPNEMAALPAGEIQKMEITLIGRKVSIVANGKRIITNQIIPGITGGALDNDEAARGPIMIQGDHGPIEILEVKLTELELHEVDDSLKNGRESIKK